MKGLVFSEFLEMVEEKFSPEMVDDILDKVDLPSGGVYTSVGNYDHAEMITLVNQLSEETGVPVGELLKTFGRYLFSTFHSNYPQFFEGQKNTFEFLHNVEQIIHVEVRKLYPNVELPSFTYQHPDDSTLVMTYSSERPLADLAEGLISGCITHFKENIEIDREDINPDKTKARFTLTKAVWES